MELTDQKHGTEIGKGRSGTVFRSVDSAGNDLAVKVFSGEDSLTKFTNYILTGAPNSYSWNEDAVRCAHLRREILTILIPFWIGSGARIARSFGIGWNDKFKAYELHTEFIDGRPAGLHHPFSKETDWELDDLVNNVMEPLQKRLAESGFDGLVWQAGKGNPIALNNFLVDNDGNWVWIDAESGVPALFPLNPLALVSFYLPRSLKYRRVLFDDVNTKKLNAYIIEKKEELERSIGSEKFANLVSTIQQLEKHQNQWKSSGRVRKSVEYQFKKENITREQAEWYFKHPALWYLKQFIKLFQRGLRKILIKLPVKVIRVLTSINYWHIIRNTFRFVFIGKYRKASVEDYLDKIIHYWEKRGQLNQEQASYLRDQVKHESASPYLSDFIILIGLKPLTNIIELLVLPSLYAAGLISEVTLAVGVSLGGVIYRTLYTLGKMIFESFYFKAGQRHSRIIALIVGLIPTIGNVAYPVQMIYAANSKSKELAKFLTYSITTRIGERIPIWGGKDTRTEHFFNHIPDIIVRRRNKIQEVS